MKKKINKVKILTVIFVGFLVLTVIFGIITRVSLGDSCYDETKYASATLSRNGDYGAIMDAKEVVEHLQDAPYILVVNHKESEEKFKCTKSTVSVKKVLRGNDLKKGDEIILYEYNNFSTYQMQGETLHYINNNPVNLMNNSDDYLVFLSKLNLTDSYKNHNPLPEFAQYGEMEMVSVFNISKVNRDFYNDENKTLSYSDVKDQEFVCYSQKSLDTLNYIKNEIMKEYIL